ncbi:bifunctional glutathionylspermidine amidase/synthase [Amphritea sp.]|uniref:bifunctional glutathionylspermidine amidase/synthase n=1 Tax=Amphritea sp. TaxID=1872502 RepID=UPI003D0D3A96
MSYMSDNAGKVLEPFGTLLGYAPGGVPAYSSDYDTASDTDYPKRTSYRSYYNGIYMGYKWQCVEFARRWMYINKGYIFDDVAMAYDIFELRTVRDVNANTLLPLNAFANGSQRHPEAGCLLIWKEGGEFEDTGHVAVVTDVTPDYVRIAEQNVGHGRWAADCDYARELNAVVTEEGEYWITCSYGDAEILGWMIQTDDCRFAEPTLTPDPQLSCISSRRIDNPAAKKKSWLNIANPDEAAFVKAMGGHFLSSQPSEQNRYLVLSRTTQQRLEHASNELHGLFMHATEYVLSDDNLLAKFNLPNAVLPKVRQSWDNRLNEVITSRFDFALTPQGLKVYEYNCDSASCYMEAGKVQGKWLSHFGATEGENGGKDLFADLVRAWKKSHAKGLVHILRDDDPEEVYHALFMQDAIRAAGLRSKIIEGLDGLSWDVNDNIIDAAGEPVQWVWKTWAWETALDQIRDELEVSGLQPEVYEPGRKLGKPLQLSDVLFHKQVMVFEPLWSLIPSNKAILPVLWSLFPNHPLLLNASFGLTDELTASGYVAKPIVGRCGANISLFNKDAELIESTAGGFGEQDKVYQQFFQLPQVDGFYTQISTFMSAGVYSGSGMRVSESRVIDKESDCLPLQFISDKQFLAGG